MGRGVVIPALDSRWLDPHGQTVTVIGYQGGQVVVQGQGVAMLVDPAAFDMEFRPAPLPGQLGGEA